ncbi:transporter substrate-binding domain-containing protein [Desulfobacterales bacterium HSG2]|nr:transporter substrate-binding domain-containing protein [Desulfobacterales bacterium HSG2]
MKKLIKTLTVIILLALPVSSQAGKLLFVSSEWPPYVFAEKGQATGIDVEIVREVCKRSGIDAEIQLFPWKRAVFMVKRGDAAGLFSAKRTKERTEFLHYPSTNLNMEKTVLLARKDKEIKITGLDALGNRRVGVVRGYTYGPKFENCKSLKKIVFNDDVEMIKILDIGRIDVVVGDEGALKFIGKKFEHIFQTVYVISEDPNYLCISKKAKGVNGASLAEKISQTLDQIKKEDFIQKIVSKYY